MATKTAAAATAFPARRISDVPTSVRVVTPIPPSDHVLLKRLLQDIVDTYARGELGTTLLPPVLKQIQPATVQTHKHGHGRASTLRCVYRVNPKGPAKQVESLSSTPLRVYRYLRGRKQATSAQITAALALRPGQLRGALRWLSLRRLLLTEGV